jgi:DNA topoisomerase-1
MKKLLIVESPAKIKTIKKFLDDSFTIMSTMGHVKDLPTKTIGVKLTDGHVELTYVPLEGKEKTIAEICKEAKKCDAIYLAPDPDREGEIIAWLIGEDIKKVVKKDTKIYRITFNEITKNAIVDAIKHPSHIDMQKVAAQQARRVLDRWVGYEVSPVLWKKLTSGLSAGRVQSVALRLICDRETAIRNFKTEEYWSIDAIFGTGNKNTITAALTNVGTKKAEIGNKETADKLATDIKNQAYTIDSIEDKQRKKNPLPPFMTSTLQQAAYNRLGFSVKKTMQIAQQLYEGVPLQDPQNPTALITYMRTDSLRVSDTALQETRDYINKSFDKDYLPSSAQFYESKGKGKSQDAHEAVRPIDVTLAPDKIKAYLSSDLAKLYELIWRRFVASQMSAASYAQRQVTIKGGKYTFKVTGSTLIFDGFLKVYNAEEDEKSGETKVKIPNNITEKQGVNLDALDPKQHFTQPPARFTEASLVKEMEKEGIGRPSTYATILNTIRARAYTKLDERKRFVPSELGMTVTDLLVKHLPRIMDIKFTANMEHDLDKIADGDLERDTLLREFYSGFKKELNEFLGHDGKTRKEAIPTEIVCPECKSHNLAIRFGKSGEFLGCAGYPECGFTANFSRDEHGVITVIPHEKPQLLEEKCPMCTKPMREMHGKFGPFKACSGYPACKYIHREIAPFKCPACAGEVVQKAWRGGKFWGCDNYPKCKFASFDAIDMVHGCPTCKWPVMGLKGKEGQQHAYCLNKECASNKK